MPAMQQNPDGTWSGAKPLDYHPGYDAEVAGVGPYRWSLYHATPEDVRHRVCREVAAGSSRTRLGATTRLVLAKWWDQVHHHGRYRPLPRP
jgi:hypothetical protein